MKFGYLLFPLKLPCISHTVVDERVTILEHVAGQAVEGSVPSRTGLRRQRSAATRSRTSSRTRRAWSIWPSWSAWSMRTLPR